MILGRRNAHDRQIQGAGKVLTLPGASGRGEGRAKGSPLGARKRSELAGMMALGVRVCSTPLPMSKVPPVALTAGLPRKQRPSGCYGNAPMLAAGSFSLHVQEGHFGVRQEALAQGQDARSPYPFRSLLSTPLASHAGTSGLNRARSGSKPHFSLLSWQARSLPQVCSGPGHGTEQATQPLPPEAGILGRGQVTETHQPVNQSWTPGGGQGGLPGGEGDCTERELRGPPTYWPSWEYLGWALP